MFIKKGASLQIRHISKGFFRAIATEDFNTKKVEFYPIKTDEEVKGFSTTWFKGDLIPCRGEFCTVTVIPPTDFIG